ncbi:MAG: nitronate monooxygenase [Bacteroidota bacterium]
MDFSTQVTDQLNIVHPIIMAPMFLVSSQLMIEEGMKNGVMATFPSLNFRKPGELAGILAALNALKSSGVSGNYGVNLIVQQTNPLYREHLRVCLEHEVPFYITSLGNPSEVIEKAHSYGGRVYCDVTNLVHARKCDSLGCDGFIAVGAGAGGHAGSNALHVLVDALHEEFPDKPVVAAGGIANGKQLAAMMVLGAAGASIGTRFIATTEAGVKQEYKDAIVEAGMDDIVMSEKISGTPCAIINTPFAKKIGYRQNWLERKLNSSKTFKKYFKMLVQLRGMKRLENSVHPGGYNNLWSAGQSVQQIHSVKPVAEVISTLMEEFEQAGEVFFNRKAHKE